MGNAKKYSLGFQLTEVSMARKARKASRISSIKRLGLVRKERKYMVWISCIKTLVLCRKASEKQVEFPA